MIANHNSPREKRIHELDGLRGIAVLGVLIWHYVGIPLDPGSSRTLIILKDSLILGRSGVGLFFVLSGFLIGSILLKQRNAGNYFFVFYVRRVLRIIPPYLVVLLILIIGRQMHPSDWRFDGPVPIMAYVSFLQNYWMSHYNTYGARWMAVTWSLAVEEQFYIIFPFIIRSLRISILPIILVMGILIAPIIRIVLFNVYVHGAHLRSYMWLVSRMDSLSVGALIAFALQSNFLSGIMRQKRKMFLYAFFIILPFFFLLGYKLPNNIDKQMTYWGYSYLDFFYGLSIIVIILYKNSGLTRVLRRRWLVHIGAISYFLYLIHEIILDVTFSFFREPRDLSNVPSIAITVGAFFISITICSIFYKVEQRFIDFGHSFKYIT